MPKDWEAHYGEAPGDRPPALVVRAYGPFLPPGPVLDLAGGLGRNARFFLARGHPVVLVERSRKALERLGGLPGLEGLELDLEAPHAPRLLPEGPFAGILLSYYVNRPLLPRLPGRLLPGGLLLLEGFTQREAERRGRPHSPHYWKEEELLTPPLGLALRAFGAGWWSGYRAFAVWARP